MSGPALMGLVDNHGPDYIFYAVMLGGCFQMLFGLMGLGALMRFVPYTVIQGFSNAMALVIARPGVFFGARRASARWSSAS